VSIVRCFEQCVSWCTIVFTLHFVAACGDSRFVSLQKLQWRWKRQWELQP
jgi:hypothetical protein